MSAITLPSWGRPGTERRRRPVPHIALAVAAFALYGLVAYARWHRADAASWDLGIFTEAVRGWATRGVPIVPIKGAGFNLLGDHWSPILALLAPAWWVWPSPVMLLMTQCALFAWSVGVVSDTAARILGRTPGLLIGLAYGLSFGLQYAVDSEFHEIAFAVPLLAVAGRQLLLGRWHRAVWWSLPLLLVKEDLGLTVAAVGAVVWWVGRERLLGAGTVLLGLGGTALEIGVLIPAFNPRHRYDYWTLAPHGSHGLWWWAGWQVTQLIKWQTLILTVGVTGFAALRSPYALLAVPGVAWRMLATNNQYWTSWWHYSATAMPVLFLAAVDGLDRLRRSRRPGLRSAAYHGPPVIAAVGLAVCWAAPLPIAQLPEASTWRPGPAGAAVRAATALIPSGVTTESWQPGLASLAARDTAYWLGGDPTPPQYVLLEPAGGQLGGLAAYEEQLHPGATYRLIYGQAGVAVLKLQ